MTLERWLVGVGVEVREDVGHAVLVGVDQDPDLAEEVRDEDAVLGVQRERRERPGGRSAA